MLWLTWRQFRVQAAAVAALVAAFGVLLLVTGPSLASVARNTGFAACHSGCATAAAVRRPATSSTRSARAGPTI